MNAVHEPIQPHQQYDDEIDLWELAICLWRGKLWVALSVGIFAALGLAYTQLAPETWRAEAQISQPSYADYQPLVTQMQNLRPAFSDRYDQKIANLRLDTPEATYGRFTSLYQSADNRRVFLRQHPLFAQSLQQTAAESDVSDINESGVGVENRALSRWSKRFSFSASEDNTSATLAVEAHNPADGVQLLTDYIAYTNNQLLEEWQIGVQSLIEIHRQSLEQTRTELQRATRDNLAGEIQRLNHALAIARAADVMNPLVDPGAQDEFAINMGANAIEAKIKELQSIEDLSVLEPKLARIEASLEALDNTELQKPQGFQAYSYQMSPAQPTDRESPRTLLILAACIFMGGILGCIGVLLAQAIHNHRREPNFQYLASNQNFPS